jgi:hypothetical protein
MTGLAEYLESERMKATLEVELHPFQTPDFVLAVSKLGFKQDGMKEVPSYPLSDLDAWTLDKLCREFRNEVFKKAGKQQPPEHG